MVLCSEFGDANVKNHTANEIRAFILGILNEISYYHSQSRWYLFMEMTVGKIHFSSHCHQFLSAVPF